MSIKNLILFGTRALNMDVKGIKYSQFKIDLFFFFKKKKKKKRMIYLILFRVQAFHLDNFLVK